MSEIAHSPQETTDNTAPTGINGSEDYPVPLQDISVDEDPVAYTVDQAIESCEEYFNGDKLAASAVVNKYLLKDTDGNLLEQSPEDMHKRLAREFARMEAKFGGDRALSYDNILDELRGFKRIIPQGSPMYGIGNHHAIVSLSNCVVIASPEDDISSIVNKGKDLANLFKRRCVEAHTLVVTEERGPLRIKDVEVGMHVLSYDLATNTSVYGKVTDKFDTEVHPSDRVIIRYDSGAELRTSRKHPVLTYTDSYSYANAGDLEIDGVGIRPEGGRDLTCALSLEDVDLGWFIGAHLGDGSCDRSDYEKGIQRKWKWSDRKYVYRMRFLGDNEEIVSEYTKIYKRMADSKGNYYPVRDGVYSVPCWEFVTCNKINRQIIESYFDDQFGSKTYTARTPDIVRDQNLWWPFIAGLVDADGWTGPSSFGLRLCARPVLEDVISFLVAAGVSCRSEILPPRPDRPNESVMYGVAVHVSNDFGKFFAPFLRHPAKRDRLRGEGRECSRTKFLSKGEVESINKEYRTRTVASTGNSYSILHLIKKSGRVGIGGLNELNAHELITDRKKWEVMQRVNITSIEQDLESDCYVDIEVEGTNNFYAGNFGLVNIHNCGAGIDISTLRPDGSNVTNSAGTTTGAWSFADFYSYICRMIGQNGRRGALMITMDVRHPDIEFFITMKQDLSKVTGANVSVKIRDDFMHAVEADEEFELRFPVDSETPTHRKMVRARDVWDKIINSATTTAEPGILMWDNILNELPAQNYASKGFNHVTTNPCFAGDTLIAVADGRNAVSIRELAEEGSDVPVYSVAPQTGEVSIQWARHPRKTGTGKKLVRVHLDDGTHLDVTPDHKFCTLEGKEVLARDLAAGASLPRFSKRLEAPTSATNSNHYYRVRCDTRNPGRDQIYEHRLIAKFYKNEEWGSIYNAAKSSGWHKGGLVVHHGDYNPTNNHISNLDIMSFKDHAKLHASKDTVGEKNGRYLGVTCEGIEKHARILTKSVGRRFSQREWFVYAKENKLPMTFSDWRSEGWYRDPTDMARAVASEMGMEHVDVDPRTVRNYQKALKQGYVTTLVEGVVEVEKECEHCSKAFTVNYLRREQGYCNHAHAVSHHNSKRDLHKARVAKTQETYRVRSLEVRKNQARVYSELAFRMDSTPFLKEWDAECKLQGISRRLGSKNGFQTYAEVRDAGRTYNHKVARLEYLTGTQDVYNLTVDQNHTVGIITDIREKNGVPDKQSNLEYHGIFAAQCGEIPLSPYDSCRLIALNLTTFVVNPYTPNAYFDFEGWATCVARGMRLSDDLVELEIEKLHQILNKVDTVDEEELWTKMLNACQGGRRTGLGTLGLGDTMSRLGLVYASEDAVEMTGRIYETFKIAAYTESVELAKERGTFGVWDHDLEKMNPFLKRLPKSLKADMKKHGRRNISLLTNAPTGTCSLCAQTSSGIEPVYKVHYTRRKKINHNDVEKEADYVDDLGDRWEEFDVFHHDVKAYWDINGECAVEDLPEYFVNADDINWERRVDMQAAIQRHVDHSLSSCLVPSTLIDTDGGLFYMDELHDFKSVPEGCFSENTTKSHKVLNHEGRRARIGEWFNNGVKPVYTLTLKNGLRLESTGNERVMVDSGEWIQVSDLKAGDFVRVS